MKRTRLASDVEALLREIQRYLAVIDATRTSGRKGGRAGRHKQKEEEE
jgi:hypothetical protein